MAQTKRRRKRSLRDMFNEYMEEIETLSEELGEAELPEQPSWDLKTCCIQPLCNVSVEADEVVVTADLPNTDPDTVKITQVDPNTVEIKAQMVRKVRFNELGITHRQGEFQFFRCLVDIPVRFDIRKMKTKFKRGFLEVHLPRKTMSKKL